MRFVLGGAVIITKGHRGSQGGPEARGYACAVLSKIFRPIIEPFTAAASTVLARARLTPDALTAIGLLAVLGVAWLIAVDRTFLAGILLIPAVIIDVLDGALARATGRVSAWGGYFDAVSDRIADGALLGALAWSARETEPRLMGAAILAMVMQFLVPYARAKAEALGFEAAGGPGERAERVVILIIGLILGLEEMAVWAIVVLAAISFVSRTTSVRRQSVRG